MCFIRHSFCETFSPTFFGIWKLYFKFYKFLFKEISWCFKILESWFNFSQAERNLTKYFLFIQWFIFVKTLNLSKDRQTKILFAAVLLTHCRNIIAFSCNAKSFAIAFTTALDSLASFFLLIFHHASPRTRVTNIRFLPLDTLANVFVKVTFIVKCRM